MTENQEEEIYNLVGDPCAEGDYATAIRHADSLLAHPSLTGMSDMLRASIMIDRDVALLESGDLDRSALYADTVIEFGRKTGTPLAVVQGLQNRGIVSRRKGDYEKAVSDYSEALEITVAEGDLDMEQTLSEMLAIACAERSRYEEATSFARRANEITKAVGDSLGELNTLSTIGGILVRSGRYEEALRELLPYHERALKEKPVLRVKYFTPLLWAYLRLDSMERVREVLAETYKALDGMPRMSQPYLVAVNSEAYLAGHEGRYSDQWKWFCTADSIGSMGSSEYERYQQRAECLANLGRYSDAYEMERRACASLDSLRGEDTDTRLAELSVKYDTLSKENEIVSLKAQRLMWILIALGASMLILIISVVAVALRRCTLRRLEKERLGEYVCGLEQGYQSMARELHDDIAGTLVGLQLRLAGIGGTSGTSEQSGEIARRISEIARRIRRMSHELMPPVFGERTFTQMLLDFVTGLNSSGQGIHITITDEGSFNWQSLSSRESMELYRMTQEAVNNAIRHGDGGEVTVTLAGDKGFSLSVANMVRPGHHAEYITDIRSGTGVGLRSLNARAAIIGAKLSSGISDGKFILAISREP